jgi:hypothetical protein
MFGSTSAVASAKAFILCGVHGGGWLPGLVLLSPMAVNTR